MDPGRAQVERLGYGCFCNAQGTRALCGDRASAARRLVDGAHIVVLSATEEGAGFGKISECDAISTLERIGRAFMKFSTRRGRLAQIMGRSGLPCVASVIIISWATDRGMSREG